MRRGIRQLRRRRLKEKRRGLLKIEIGGEVDLEIGRKEVEVAIEGDLEKEKGLEVVTREIIGEENMKIIEGVMKIIGEIMIIEEIEVEIGEITGGTGAEIERGEGLALETGRRKEIARARIENKET